MKAARLEFMKAQLSMDSSKLVFIDESASNLAMTRRYSRAPRGERAVAPRPVHPENITMVGALRTTGMGAMMTLPGAMNGPVFLAWIREVLVPTIRPGEVVVMDNLSVHKVDGVADTIEAAGASLLYLPPYSPELNPIEECWSKMKTLLRTAAARTQDKFNQAIVNAMANITPTDCAGWYRHAGYPIQST